MTKTPARVFAAACLALFTGCTPGGSSPAGEHGTVSVFAASSLRESFTELESVFETEHPEIDLQLVFAGSQDLVAQMQAGAPADVFVSASSSWMRTAEEASLIRGRGEVFATNHLEIAVAEKNPRAISSIASLAEDSSLVVARCAPQVPCGEVTDRVLREYALTLEADTEVNSVTDALGLVMAGEADAALVYATDIASHEDAVDGVAIENSEASRTTYEIAVTAHPEGSAPGAEAFVDFVTEGAGRDILTEAGFDKAGAP